MTLSVLDIYWETCKINNYLKDVDDCVAQLDRDTEDFHDVDNQQDLQTLVDDIISGASNLADSVCTREKTREKIITESKNVQAAVCNLLQELDHHADGKPNGVDVAKKRVGKKAKDLTKQLQRSVVDHVSDTFLETNMPILLLIEAAESGNGREVEDCSTMFTNHAEKLQKVADLACSMSANAEGVKMVKLAAHQLKILFPQVINAAHTLADRPKSKAARENMKVFKDAWIQQVRILTEAVDDITTIDDFLSVSEAHILEDINHCIKAMQNGEAENLDRIAGAVRGRVARVDHVVTSEMENYEPGYYTDAVYRAVGGMRNRIMTEFAECIEMVVDALSTDKSEEIDQALFIDVAGLVHEGMREIRKAVAMRDDNGGKITESEDEFDPKESLLQQIADAQAQQRERLAYEQLTAGGKIQFEVHSEAIDDPGYKGESQIMVNGIDYCPKKRGHNVVVLDQCGTVVKQQAFDTTQHKEGVAMAKFLDEIPDDHIALIAVQETGGDGIRVAADALKRLGAIESADVGYGASWAFAGYKGDHQNKHWVTEVTRPRYQGPTMISDMINTPASDKGKIHVHIHAEGCQDKPYNRIASIKINTIERSPIGRGMNVVILDKAGNYLLSKNFDTADPYHAVNEGKRMSKFLDELPEERMVAIASLESTGYGVDAAKEALYRIGAKGQLSPSPNGSFAFIGYTSPDKVDWLNQVQNRRGEGPSIISDFILTPAAAEEESSEGIFSASQGSSIPDYLDDKYERIILRSENLEEPVKQSASSIMRQLPDEEKAKIYKLNEGFLLEKNRLISEVSKWDEAGNEIIVLAKRMCMIMMDMSDFTRGVGPLRTTVDVIKAAEKIGKYGSQLNKLAGEIAEQCPHSHTRSDLLAYLQRVALYSHQLSITARVKSDVQMIGGEMIVSGVESATSLIQAAKNLMNAVILAVKSSYIASTKHRTPEQEEVVTWRMRVPEKKPLLEKNDFEPRYSKIQQQRYTDSPAPSLGNFQ